MMNILQQAVLYEQDVVYYEPNRRVEIYVAYGDHICELLRFLPEVHFRTYEEAQAYFAVYEQMISELVEEVRGRGKEVVRVEHEQRVFERHMPFVVAENTPVELEREQYCWRVQTLDFEGLEDGRPPRYVLDGAIIYQLGTYLEVELITMHFED